MAEKFVVLLDYQHGEEDEDPSFSSQIVGVFDDFMKGCREGRRQEILYNWKIPRTETKHPYLLQYNKIDTMSSQELLDDFDDLREEFLALTEESYEYKPRGYTMNITPVRLNIPRFVNEEREKELKGFLLK